MSTTKSSVRDGLLKIINDRERELENIRQAAYNASEEEEREVKEKLTSLRSDFEHNLKVLYQKDETIQNLHHRIKEIETQYAETACQLERKSAQLDQVHQSQLAIEDELESKFKKRESDLHDSLQSDYHNKLLTAKRDLQERYHSMVESKLKDQAEQLWEKFDRIMEAKVCEFDHEKKELNSKVFQVEEKMTEMNREFERAWSLREREIQRKAKEDSYQRISHEVRAIKDEKEDSKRHLERQITSLVKERDKFATQQEYLQQQIEKLHRALNESNYKVNDLLQVISRAEKGYNMKLAQFNSDTDIKEKLINSLRHKLDSVQNEYRECQSSLEQCNHVIGELKADLQHFKMKKKSEHLIRKSDKQRDKEEIEKLNETCGNLTKKITLMAVENEEERERINTIKERNKALISQVNESHSSTCQKIDREYNEKLREEQINFEKEMRVLIREKETLIRQKDDTDRLVENLQIKIKKLQAEISSHQSHHQEEIGVRQEETRKLHRELHQSHTEKDGLKNIIASMRLEMQRMSQDINNKESVDDNPPSSSRKETVIDEKEVAESRAKEKESSMKIAELQNSLNELQSQFNLVLSERHSLICVSNRLRSEIRRMADATRDQSEDIDDPLEEEENTISDPSIDAVTDADESESTHGNEELEIAKCLWANTVKAVRNNRKGLPFRASERTTSSQRLSHQKLQEREKIKVDNTTRQTIYSKVRNWNDHTQIPNS